MENEVFDSMSEVMLTPADFITLMFERTNEDGILYIPGWHYNRPGWEFGAPGSTDEEYSYRCKMDWNLAKYEKVLAKFNDLYASLEEIGKKYEELEENSENVEAILGSGVLLDVWNLYLRELDDGGFDQEKFDEIYDKLYTVANVKDIASRIVKGEQIEDFEKETLTEDMGVTVTAEELKYRRDYLDHRHKESERRFGPGICAYDLYLRPWRICKLISLGAPKIIILNEARQFAAAFVLHEYGISRELVDNNIRLRLEQMELMSDDELDELYRPQKANKLKSMAPLFICDILSKKSNSKTHLRQQDILKELQKYPYEITLERKALSRIIHNLIDLPQYAVFSDTTGVWMDQE